jgi:hypothetical protein
MTLGISIALLALLAALFALVALVAVYARVRALEASRAAGLSGYPSLIGHHAPRLVRPCPGQRGGIVAVLDADCALCHDVWGALAAAAERDPSARYVALVDREIDLPAGCAELVVDATTRADMFEGYAPTLLVLDAVGVVIERAFVYADTDINAVLENALPPGPVLDAAASEEEPAQEEPAQEESAEEEPAKEPVEEEPAQEASTQEEPAEEPVEEEPVQEEAVQDEAVLEDAVVGGEAKA